MRAIATILALAMIVALPAAQTPAPAARNGVISGRIVEAGTGRPVSAAIVAIVGTGLTTTGPNSATRIVTGADGRFVFSELPTPGRFSINASKGGYAEGAYGMQRPTGSSQSIELAAGQKTADVVVRMWKHAAITGTVTDEAGEPVVGVQVRALMRRAGAARQFGGAVASARTDDRGVYRFGSLLPGDYIVLTAEPGLSVPAGIFADARARRGAGELAGLAIGALSVQNVRVGDALYGTGPTGLTPPPPAGTRMQIYPPTFHPNAIVPSQAAIVTVGSGEERASIDLQLTLVTTLRVSGTLSGPGGPVGMAPIRLVASGNDLIPAEALGALGVTDGSGTFIFPAVVPGNYVLKTEARESLNQGWVAMPIAVGGDDIDGVVAMLQPPLRITARLQFEGNAAPPAPTGRALPFNLEPEDGSPSVSLAAPGATPDALTLVGYAPGRYRVRVANSPAGWMFKAAMLDGVDVSVTPFEFSRDITDLTLIFTDRWSGVGGAVQGSRVDRAVVILFPADSRAWINAGPNPRRLRSVRADAQGRFGIRSVPPGDYYVVAIPDEQSGDWRDPAMLDTLVRMATQVSIIEGEHKMLDLQLREVRQ